MKDTWGSKGIALAGIAWGLMLTASLIGLAIPGFNRGELMAIVPGLMLPFLEKKYFAALCSFNFIRSLIQLPGLIIWFKEFVNSLYPLTQIHSIDPIPITAIRLNNFVIIGVCLFVFIYHAYLFPLIWHYSFKKTGIYERIPICL